MEKSRWEEAASEPQEREGREREREREISLQIRLSSHTDPTRQPSACISVRKRLRLNYYCRFFRLGTFVIAYSLVAMLKRVFGEVTCTLRTFTDRAVRSMQLYSIN